MTEQEIREFVRHVIEHGDGGAGAVKAITGAWVRDLADARINSYSDGHNQGWADHITMLLNRD